MTGLMANSRSTVRATAVCSIGGSKRRLAGPSVVRASSTGGVTTHTRRPESVNVCEAIVMSSNRPLRSGRSRPRTHSSYWWRTAWHESTSSLLDLRLA